MSNNSIYIVDAIRTPIGSFQGSLKSVSSPQLGARLVRALLDRLSIEASTVNECILGSVLTAGQGQAPARQAALLGGLEVSTNCLTVNKVCSSGLLAVELARRSVSLGISDVVFAGGMESMSQVPFYVPHLRGGHSLGDDTLVDGIIKDGLWDVYKDYHMGCAGELCAEHYSFTREMQDAFAIESYARANQSIANGVFGKEIVPIEIAGRKGEVIVDIDEEPGRFIAEKIGKLSTVFKKDGTITAANASSLSDGAAMLCLASERAVKDYGLKPRAQLIGFGTFSQDPEWFTTAPIFAMKNAAKASGLPIADFDCFEINEAFSAVTMACAKELKLDMGKVNIRGGAVALGHPIGASGARILVTLLNVLETEGLETGLVGICNGGGEATSMAIRLV